MRLLLSPAPASRSRHRQTIVAFIVPLLLFLLLARSHAVTHYWRDPTSVFFDPSRGYAPSYSKIRTHQADAFVQLSNNQTFQRNSDNVKDPLICVAMLTIARPSGDVYFRSSVGSLLAGLSQRERDQIVLVPFIAHTNASSHPAFQERWLANVADWVMTYNNSKAIKEGQWEHVRQLEREREITGLPDREKHLFDYGLALKECVGSGAKYVAIFEDDVVALDGWFHRTKKALNEIEGRTKAKGENGWFYLRLFYTEGQLGWNQEEWPMYLGWVSFFLALAISVNFLIFYFFRRATFIRNNLLPVIYCSVTAVAIMAAFFFMAGRVSMLPLAEGVHEMAKYGCCAQAIVYPKEKVPLLTKWYEESRIGFVDTLAERLGDERPDEVGLRWAITPSVVQHVGGRSSKGDAQWDGAVKYVDGKATAARLWNFAFETNDVKALRDEHLLEISRLDNMHLDYSNRIST